MDVKMRGPVWDDRDKYHVTAKHSRNGHKECVNDGVDIRATHLKTCHVVDACEELFACERRNRGGYCCKLPHSFGRQITLEQFADLVAGHFKEEAAEDVLQRHEPRILIQNSKPFILRLVL